MPECCRRHLGPPVTLIDAATVPPPHVAQAQHPRCRLSVAAGRSRLQSAATIRADHASMQRHCNRYENRVKAQPVAGRRRALTSEELALRLSIGCRNDGAFVLDSLRSGA